MKFVASSTSPPLGAVLASKFVSNDEITLEWGNETSLQVSPSLILDTSAVISKYIARLNPKLQGVSAYEKTLVDHWLSFSFGPLSNSSEFPTAIKFLNNALEPVTYLVGTELTIADLNVFAALKLNADWAKLEQSSNATINVTRWFKYIDSLPQVKLGLASLPSGVLDKSKKEPSSSEPKQEGKFVDLPGAEMGKVVVRFPPEASGYLHIGHAKAALLNWYYKELFNGILIMRFDDTNPDKEKVDFEKVILEDLKLLEIYPDKFTHTSDHFPMLLELCEKMIRSGSAYVDDTAPEQMKTEREARQPSRNRDNTPEKNFAMWNEMLKGSQVGQSCCVRAKIDMSSDNGCMRDPTIYRCKNEPHPRTGSKYKVYPTYDFACPIVDSVEGVTHALRTMEYHDRDDQFYWFIDELKLRKPYIYEYARLNMMNTVLSKRKLTWFVEQGLVESWEDPRFPTVRGVLRRGMTVQGLKQFIIAQGSSRSVVQMEWDKIWAFNKKVIDPIAPRYTALESASLVTVNVKGAKPESLTVPKHPKNNDIGNKTVLVGPQVLIAAEDAALLKEGENATFINWGNLKIDKLHRDGSGQVTQIDAQLNLSDTNFKKTLKLTWLAKVEAKLTPIQVLFYDHIITKPVLAKDEDFKQYINKDSVKAVSYIGDPELATLKSGDIIQLQRIGFFRVDVPTSPKTTLTLIHIPDGSSKSPTVSTEVKKSAANNQSDVALTDKDLEGIADKWTEDRNKVATSSQLTNHLKNLSDKITSLALLIHYFKHQNKEEKYCDALRSLLVLRREYCAVSGQEWKLPIRTPVTQEKSASACHLYEKIQEQDKLVQKLKAEKASVTDIEEAVKLSVSLKYEFKAVTGNDWINVSPLSASKSNSDVGGLAEKIREQRNSVLKLRQNNAPLSEITPVLKTLVKFSTQYRAATGKDWKTGNQPVTVPAPNSCDSGILISGKITEQGDLVRKLKADKAPKADIDAAVKSLLALKSEYKAATGNDWKPGAQPVPAPAVPISTDSGSLISGKITEQGNLVRKLKADKASKADIDAAVKSLLSLKSEYKVATGKDWKPDAQPVTVPAPAATAAVTTNGSTVTEKIPEEDDSLLNLAALIEEVNVTVLSLSPLELEEEYKRVSGETLEPVGIKAAAPSSDSGSVVSEKITEQGNLVRKLKADKASKADIDAAVKSLLSLKNEYKVATGKDWKPDAQPVSAPAPAATAPTSSDTGSVISGKITEQGDLVRKLKADKASKADIDAAVKLLLALKSEYKVATGNDWKPGAQPVPASAAPTSTDSGSLISEKITEQGNLVRKLKADKASKADIDAAVKSLLSLKSEYKVATGKDWKPDAQPVSAPAPAAKKSEAPKSHFIGLTLDQVLEHSEDFVQRVLRLYEEDPDLFKISSAKPKNLPEMDLDGRITLQGDKIRDLKAAKADKATIEAEVKTLLLLKSEYKNLNNQDWQPKGGAPPQRQQKEKKPENAKKPEKKGKEKADKEKSVEKDDEKGMKKQTRLGLEARKEENLPDWYSQVITKGEMIEYYDVSGCYILRPWAFAVWESIQTFLDKEIKKLGVVNAYFPMFVSKSVLEREKAHIADFAPEVAWVTKSGDSDLAEHIAIRPTSETAMYPAYAKWIQSHRDLPLRLNQWNNVVRWEFKHPQPFLRTREFLWQEGHTAFATYKEAEEEVYQILDLYARVYTDLLAIPVVKGRKTEKEKFAGGDFTTTVEAYISASGRGIQGATSHHLGQNFSKMFDITVEDPESKEKMFVFQNSWGITTRTIGVMIMVHADNQGLVMPPAVSALQIVIVPCGITASLAERIKIDLINTCKQLDTEFSAANLRSKLDDRDNYSPGWKFNHWELKGVPLRIELGPKDLEKKQLVAVRRDTGEKITIALTDAADQIQKLLNTIQASLLDLAEKELASHTKTITAWNDFCPILDAKNIILAPFCETIECEENIKKDSARDQDLEPGAPAMGAKSLCIPFQQPAPIKPSDKCIHPSCKKPAKSYTLFGRSY